ncbi:extensin family protein [Yoonia sp. SS1-5]|uniref:Extensin family protein n=1 Tax=Yoonia rhodophyticola TaxID=3137370 RepID=A0AAN0NJD2_9RHOB
MRHAKRQAMAQDAADKDDKVQKRGRPILRGAVTLLFLAALGYGGHLALTHPDTPLPQQWNPLEPLRIADPVTPLTGWKLNRAAADGMRCIAALQGSATIRPLEDLNQSASCHIRDRVSLDGVGAAGLTNVDTRCAIALRMAMWEEHSLQPSAQAILGTTVTRIDHIGSFSCRQMRTPGGPTGRMSTHATANAIDIAGFRFADGTSAQLLRDWDSGDARAAFLTAARDGACDWFNLTLSPDYNSLHADHFHLQSTGWGLCR